MQVRFEGIEHAVAHVGILEATTTPTRTTPTTTKHSNSQQQLINQHKTYLLRDVVPMIRLAIVVREGVVLVHTPRCVAGIVGHLLPRKEGSDVAA